jgi:hypothetical protein
MVLKDTHQNITSPLIICFSMLKHQHIINKFNLINKVNRMYSQLLRVQVKVI